MRARNKRFIIRADQTDISCEVSGWDPLGASISNPTVQWLFFPTINDWIAPQSRGTFALGGEPVVPVAWGAPPGITQPSPITAPVPQQASIVLTDQPLPNAGGPIVLAASSAVSWLDGTEALPGFPNTNDLTLGLYRPGANRFGFSVAGVERFELGIDYARIRDGTVAAPSLGFLLEGNTGISRPTAGALAVSVLGNEVARFTATTFQPQGGGNRDLGTAALEFSTLFADNWRGGTGNDQRINLQANRDLIFQNNGTEVGRLTGSSPAGFAIGTTPAVAGALRIPSNVAGLYARNNANTADVSVIRTDGGDAILIAEFGQQIKPSGNMISAGSGDFAGSFRIRTLGAFVAGDHYVIADANGNLHLSALGPAS